MILSARISTCWRTAYARVGETFANVMKYILMGTSSNFGNMFSMAAGVLLLPFLPMLPTQILLNNLLYDMSESRSRWTMIRDGGEPRRWNLAVIRRFMFVLGPVSSVFDFMTFDLLLRLPCRRGAFHTGWFVELLDANPGDLHYPHDAPLARSAEPGARGKFALCLRRGCGASLFAARSLARLRSGARQRDGRSHACNHHLSSDRLWRETVVLQALSAGLGP